MARFIFSRLFVDDVTREVSRSRKYKDAAAALHQRVHLNPLYNYI